MFDKIIQGCLVGIAIFAVCDAVYIVREILRVTHG